MDEEKRLLIALIAVSKKCKKCWNCVNCKRINTSMTSSDDSICGSSNNCMNCCVVSGACNGKGIGIGIGIGILKRNATAWFSCYVTTSTAGDVIMVLNQVIVALVVVVVQYSISN